MNLDTLIGILRDEYNLLSFFEFNCRYDYRITNASSNPHYNEFDKRTEPTCSELQQECNLSRLKIELSGFNVIIAFGDKAVCAVKMAIPSEKMIFMTGEFKTPNETLYNAIEEIYDQYFRPETPYSQKLAYNNVVNYGFVDFERREYYSKREFSADDYVSYLGTHCDHIVLKEPYKSKFYAGVRDAILEAGDKIILNDTIVLYLARKP